MEHDGGMRGRGGGGHIWMCACVIKTATATCITSKCVLVCFCALCAFVCSLCTHIWMCACVLKTAAATCIHCKVVTATCVYIATALVFSAWDPAHDRFVSSCIAHLCTSHSLYLCWLYLTLCVCVCVQQCLCHNAVYRRREPQRFIIQNKPLPFTECLPP